ncbi:MAG TPA: metallophosphoesterase [Phycisphaerales bacterium]|nr:metallophosphoesterase [Phycisphaerales bacterium]
MAINILCVGDVVGHPGRGMLADHLPRLIRDHQLELVVCNAENAAGGSGITPQIFRKLLHYGVDVVTLGDHVFRKVDIVSAMRDSDRIVRPANLSSRAAGRSWTVVPTKSGQHKVGVACVLGQMYMGQYDSPWTTIDRVLLEMPPEVKLRVVDFHGEATSEKVAIGWHLNGRASVVFGTHTHIPTADARVLSGGTAHITDVGMTGPYDSVLGRRKDRVLAAMTTSMPHFFEVANDDPRLCGVLVSVDPETGMAQSIERIEVCGRLAQSTPAEAEENGAATESPDNGG